MLVECIECGRRLSDTCRVCPHCGADWRGVGCRWCHARLHPSKAVAVGSSAYHADCLSKLVRAYFSNARWNVSCRECHFDLSRHFDLEPPATEISDLVRTGRLRNHEAFKKTVTCSNCGYGPVGVYAYDCEECGLPVVSGLHEVAMARTGGEAGRTHYRHGAGPCKAKHRRWLKS